MSNRHKVMKPIQGGSDSSPVETQNTLLSDLKAEFKPLLKLERTMIRTLLISLIMLGASVNAHAQSAPKVVLNTNLGSIELELDPAAAPISVENFLNYVTSGFYDGTIFHRVIKGFMIQGGGFTEQYSRKETRDEIKNEANNGRKNNRGTIAMARTAEPHSATAQFFINTVDNEFLNFTAETPRGWGYAVFGQVTNGLEVVDKIEASLTGAGGPFPSDVPQTPVIIESAQVLE